MAQQPAPPPPKLPTPPPTRYVSDHGDNKKPQTPKPPIHKG